MNKFWLKRLIWPLLFCLLLSAPALAGMAQYSYDSLGRLVRVQYDNGGAIEYTYDAAGNRTARQVWANAPPPAPPGQGSGSPAELPLLQTYPPPSGSQ